MCGTVTLAHRALESYDTRDTCVVKKWLAAALSFEGSLKEFRDNIVSIPHVGSGARGSIPTSPIDHVELADRPITTDAAAVASAARTAAAMAAALDDATAGVSGYAGYAALWQPVPTECTDDAAARATGTGNSSL